MSRDNFMLVGLAVELIMRCLVQRSCFSVLFYLSIMYFVYSLLE